jgi:hypothetical protein
MGETPAEGVGLGANVQSLAGRLQSSTTTVKRKECPDAASPSKTEVEDGYSGAQEGGHVNK